MPELYLSDCNSAMVDVSAHFTAGLPGNQMVPVATGKTVSFLSPYHDFNTSGTRYRFIKSEMNLSTPVNGQIVF